MSSQFTTDCYNRRQVGYHPGLLFLLKTKKSFPAVWQAALLNCSITVVVVVIMMIIIIIISVDNFRTPSDSHMI